MDKQCANKKMTHIDSINLEYAQYKVVQHILSLRIGQSRPIGKSVRGRDRGKKRGGQGPSKRDQYEYRNIIERWILSVVNEKLARDKEQKVKKEEARENKERIAQGSSPYRYSTLFFFQVPTSSYNVKLAQELQDKKIDRDGLIDDVLGAVNSFLESDPSKDKKVKLVLKYESHENNLNENNGDNDNNISEVFNDNKKDKKSIILPNITVSEGTYKFITLPMSKAKLTELKKCSNSSVLRMVLRYSTLVNGGQQWAVPKEVFNCLYKKCKFLYEGFASPLNSGFSDLRAGKFCSLFLDTDKPFGSMGSFFDNYLEFPNNGHQKFGIYKINTVGGGVSRNTRNKRKGGNVSLNNHVGWVVNPPFVEAIMDRASEHIVKSLNNANTINLPMTVAYVLPSWEDNKGYATALKSKWCRHITRFDKKSHFYEHQGKKIVIGAKTTMFILQTDTGAEIVPAKKIMDECVSLMMCT